MITDAAGFFFEFLKAIDDILWFKVNGDKQNFFEALKRVSQSTDRQKEVQGFADWFKDVGQVIESEINSAASPVLWMDFAFWNLFQGHYDRLDFFISAKNEQVPSDVKDKIRQFYTRHSDFFLELQSQLIYPLNTAAYTFGFSWEEKVDGREPTAGGMNKEIILPLEELGGFDLTEMKHLAKFLPDTGEQLRREFPRVVARFLKEQPQLAARLNIRFLKIKQLYKYEAKAEQEFGIEELLKIILLNRLTDDNWKYLYIIPGKLFKEVGAGGCFVACDRKLDDASLFLLQEAVNKISTTFSVSFNWEYKEANLKKANIKSATAAIMSRNISHNLGSHVLSYIKNDLGSTNDMLVSGVIDNLLDPDLRLVLPAHADAERLADRIRKIQADEASAGYHTHGSASYLMGLSHLLNYIQERQDYIATVASSIVPYFSTVNFKDHVLDEFTHDAKARRHQGSHEPRQNLLLKYIALSEQKSRCFLPTEMAEGRNNIEFRLIFKKLGEPPVSFETYNLGGTPIDSRLRMINIELPAGVMGRQAFFSILENIIRNTAKHGRVEGKLLFEIEIEEVADSPYFQVTVFTNEAGDVHRVRDLLEEKLASSLIKQDGRLEESNKGLKEISISAAWLRNIILPDNTERDRKILEVVVHEERLGFRFCLFKARKVALVMPDETGKAKIAARIAGVPGWEVFTIDEFLQNTFSFRLYVIDDTLTQREKVIDGRYPSRTWFTAIGQDVSPSDTDFDKLFLRWYERYLRSRFSYLPAIVASDNLLPPARFKKVITCKTDEWDSRLEGLTEPVLLFKKHLNEQENFNDFLKFYTHKKLDKKILGVESITGHNSTDRLMHHEEMNEEWWLRMVESALARILIIDERLWQKITEAKISFFNEEKLLKGVNEILRDQSIQSPDEKIGKIEELAPFLKEDARWNRLFFNDPGSIIPYLRETIKAKTAVTVRKNYQAALYRLNRIRIATFILDGTDNSFRLYMLPEKDGDIREEYTAKIDDQGKPTIRDPRTLDEGFDFIVIHQGILDKFIVTDNSGAARPSTAPLFDILRNNLFKPPAGRREPVFIIHSGRSRPPEDTYPDASIPFIQYSSVESSFNDCKYTLTELLFSAINID